VPKSLRSTWWDHPRVRGEQHRAPAACPCRPGSSPRARGAGHRSSRVEARRRIIPACAGSRAVRPGILTLAGDHPRVRGEQSDVLRGAGWSDGSSPRARGADLLSWGAVVLLAGIHSLWFAGLRVSLFAMQRSPRCRGQRRAAVSAMPPSAPCSGQRTEGKPDTTACVESSCSCGWCGLAAQRHPRRCGERWCGQASCTGVVGSSPRARGAGRPAS
jgi:hypothetical protein